MMKTSLVVTLTAVALVNAQSVSDLPACSLQCFAAAVATTTCATTDYVCQCSPSNKQLITDSVTPCLTTSTCSITELENIQQWSETFCPNILASASPKPTPQVTATSNSQLLQASPSASAAAQSASPAVPASPTSPTSSIVDLLNWGANYPGTNWRSSISHTRSDRAPAVEGVSIVLFIIASLVVGFRLYARLRTQQLRQVAQGLGWDEFFACIALAFTGGVLGTVVVGVKNGMGKHQDYQSAQQLTTLVKSVYVFTILICTCFWALKISILCLYLRMTPDRKHRIIIYIVMGIVTAHSIATVFGNIFQCNPISDYWNIAKIFNRTMGCVNLIAMDIFNSAWSVFENIIIWTMPIPVVWKLKVPRDRKAGLYILIAVSFIAVIASCIRVSALVLWIRSSDISWNYPLIPLLCMIQSSVALVTSSLPAIYPLLRKPTPEQISRRAFKMPPAGSDAEKAWNSQGSTLNQISGDRRSRWSFLTWTGYKEARMAHAGFSDVPEETGEKEAGVEVEESEVRPVTQHTMTAYVSSGEEARSINEQIHSHRRTFSADEESLTVARIYMGGSRDGDSGTSRATQEDYHGIGAAL